MALTNPACDIAVIGLAVMGQNLALNLNDHGFRVAVYNRSPEKTDAFLLANGQPATMTGCHTLPALVDSLARPRKILLMVQAGKAVDDTINHLLPLLDHGDIIIDGGNSHFSDTSRRCHELSANGIRYIGAGVSGGEEGARRGPSLMPGGDANAWPEVRPLFDAIAAKIDNKPCCTWIGPEGSGHYVKMVHNGIEYGDMQLIAEAYDFLHRGLNFNHSELHSTFSEWNRGLLDSYLMEITANIFTVMDNNGQPLLESILDAAGQKGTGKWTVNEALDQGTSLTLISEAVFARALSSRKEERMAAQVHFRKQVKPVAIDCADDKTRLTNAVHDALYAAKIISYAQGFMLLRDAARHYGWQPDYAAIARIWRGGCIIRSRFLDDIAGSFTRNPKLENLLLDKFFTTAIQHSETGLRTTLQTAIGCGIPMPAMASALAFLDGCTSAYLPANLIQAQRDYFGAHTYERTDRPRGEFFHTDWSGHHED